MSNTATIHTAEPLSADARPFPAYSPYPEEGLLAFLKKDARKANPVPVMTQLAFIVPVYDHRHLEDNMPCDHRHCYEYQVFRWMPNKAVGTDGMPLGRFIYAQSFERFEEAQTYARTYHEKTSRKLGAYPYGSEYERNPARYCDPEGAVCRAESHCRRGGRRRAQGAVHSAQA